MLNSVVCAIALTYRQESVRSRGMPHETHRIGTRLSQGSPLRLMRLGSGAVLCPFALVCDVFLVILLRIQF